MFQTDTAGILQVPFWHHDGYMMGGHWGWWIFWLAIAGLVLWGLARSAGSGGGSAGSGSPESAEDALRRRYAAGEISREEFEERLKVLRSSR